MIISALIYNENTLSEHRILHYWTGEEVEKYGELIGTDEFTFLVSY